MARIPVKQRIGKRTLPLGKHNLSTLHEMVLMVVVMVTYSGILF